MIGLAIFQYDEYSSSSGQLKGPARCMLPGRWGVVPLRTPMFPHPSDHPSDQPAPEAVDSPQVIQGDVVLAEQSSVDDKDTRVDAVSKRHPAERLPKYIGHDRCVLGLDLLHIESRCLRVERVAS